MRRAVLAGLLGAAPLILAAACTGVEAQALPRAGTRARSEVDRFIDRRDACEHFLDEEPYDDDRTAFLTRKVRETCAGIDAQLARLRRKFRDDARVLARLSPYAPVEDSARR